MVNEIVKGVLEALEAVHGRAAVLAACAAYTQTDSVIVNGEGRRLHSRNRAISVYLSAAQYERIATIARASKIEGIKLLRQIVNGDKSYTHPEYVGLKECKEMIESIDGVEKALTYY